MLAMLGAALFAVLALADTGRWALRQLGAIRGQRFDRR
jgi:hypothetical protein